LASLAKIERPVAVAKEAAHKVLHRDEVETQGKIDVGGPVLEYFILHGILPNGTVKIISGRPTRTSLSPLEVKQYLFSNGVGLLREKAIQLAQKQEKLLHRQEIEDLTREKAETNVAAEKKRREELIRELKKDAANADPREKRKIRNQARQGSRALSDLKRRLSKPALLMAETYLFEDDVLVTQIGRTEWSLSEYGKVNLQNQQIYVYGMLYEMPQVVDFGGRKFHFCLFDPWDTRDIEDGGVIKTIGLTQDDRQAFLEYVKGLFQFTSFLKTKQQLVTALKENTALKQSLAKVQKKVGEYLGAIDELREELQTGALGGLNISSILVSLLVAITTCGLIGAGFGLLVDVFLGVSQTITVEPVYNDTSHVFIRNDRVIAQNSSPYAVPVAIFFTLGGCFFGVMLSARLWGHKK